MSKYIVTSALPYAEGVPHLGNFIGSILPADVYYKYLRLMDKDAIFICGSDQHGTPIEIQALKKGITPQELSDSIHERTKESMSKFECTFTFYGKTNSDKNKETVYYLFDKLNKNGYIDKVDDIQPYCNKDKLFLADRFIEGKCPVCGAEGARGDQCDNCGSLLNAIDLIDPHCKICGGTDISFKKTVNLALDLKKLQPKIREFVVDRMNNNWSKNAIKKTLSYIDGGLKPRDITRSINWGFDVPLKGFEDKKFYVWFDAVIGYIGITREWNEKRWKDYWKSDETKLIQFMGKDNIEFHTMMWPGILIGSDDGFVLPYTIKAYEYLTSTGIKFSKSNNVGINVENSLEILDADYWRFVLLYKLPETSDTDFSIEVLKDTIDKIMNDKIGNFINRVLTIAKSNSTHLKEIKTSGDYKDKESKLIKNYEDNFNNINIREALHDLIDLAELGNSLISTTEPWKLAKKLDDKDIESKFKEILGNLITTVYHIGILSYPFIPKASSEILSYFNIEGIPKFAQMEDGITVNYEKPVKPLFEKLSKDKIDKLSKF